MHSKDKPRDRSVHMILGNSLSTSNGSMPTCSQDCLSKGAFAAFETKLFFKLNLMQQMMSEIKNDNPRREVYKCPILSDKVELPAATIAALVNLDEELADEKIREQMASYLSQLGGRRHSDFLVRALPQVMKDELCYLTNWSGSAIPPGSQDHDGEPITREFKKTFSNLSNIVTMLCIATQKILPETTNVNVEDYIKKWLLCYKDRLNPRNHKQQKTNKSPKKTNRSPKKRCATKNQ